MDVNLADWQITTDRTGRNNKVIVITLDNQIMLDVEVETVKEALARASKQGPLFVLFEIDTPGGRIDYARRICTAIIQEGTCPVYAFIKGGQYGGAISAGAAVAFACERIYMAPGTTIGAAAPIALLGKNVMDFDELYGGQIAEKIRSSWRAYLAALAEQNHRPSLLAGAMADSNIQVIEVNENSQRLFIEPVNKKTDQQIVKTWTAKGSLLTLTADQAVSCGIADTVVASRGEILARLNASQTQLVIDDSVQQASRQFERAKRRWTKISTELDLEVKQFKQVSEGSRALKMLKDIREDYRLLITLAKRCPDLNVNVAELERQLNTVEAFYEEAKLRRPGPQRY
jgi:ATP-dependent protease ClpP protease subunit